MNISLKIVDEFDKEVYEQLVKENLHANRVFIDERSLYTDGDKGFKGSNEKIRIGAFNGDELIGLAMGASTDKHSFMMHLSLVKPSYRNQGIYTQMLNLMLDKARHYDIIESCHHVMNNSIIAKKLRHDFYIVGFETIGMIGPIVKLHYYNNKKLLDIMKFRTGIIKQPEF